MPLSDRLSVKNIVKLNRFDRYQGDRRTDIKHFDRTIEYRGFKIKRNGYIPNGAHGRWEVPSLKYPSIGGMKEGFLTVSIIQSKEAIDRWFDMNEKLN